MPALTVYANDNRNELIGEWEGIYYNNFGLNGLRLSVFMDGVNYKAIFSFFPVEGSPAEQESGSFYSDVRFNNQTNELEIIGATWIERPHGWEFVNLFGTISNNIFSGAVRWDGFFWPIFLETFSLTRVNAGELDNDDIRVFLNGERIRFDQPPIIEDGRILVPIRAIAEAMGGTVEWDDATETATIQFYNIGIQITRDVNFAQIINRISATTKRYYSMRLEVPMRVIEDRSFVPLRFVAQSFESEVIWESNRRVAYIISPPKIPEMGGWYYLRSFQGRGGGQLYFIPKSHAQNAVEAIWRQYNANRIVDIGSIPLNSLLNVQVRLILDAINIGQTVFNISALREFELELENCSEYGFIVIRRIPHFNHMGSADITFEIYNSPFFPSDCWLRERGVSFTFESPQFHRMSVTSPDNWVDIIYTGN